NTHLLVNEDALIEKNVAFEDVAMHLPTKVFPVPGGPKSKRPLGGPLKPVKRSLNFIKN
ncbi:MAG: hypothetical protein MHPSP_004562, partial [Paramarteilia canceri]